MMLGRWVTVMTLIPMTLLRTPVALADEQPARENQHQFIQEKAPAQEEPQAQSEPEAKEERKKARQEEKQERRKQKKADKSGRKKGKQTAEKTPITAEELKSRIARATDPSLNDRLRSRAIRRLSLTDDPQATATLLGLAKDEKEPLHIRTWAIQGLGEKLADKKHADAKNAKNNAKNKEELVQRLLEILRHATEPSRLRAEAAIALGSVKDPVAINALQEASKDKSPEVRTRAAMALHGLGIDQVRLMGQLLNDEELSGESRAVAAKLLGWSGDPKAADPLIRALLQRPKPTTSPAVAASATEPAGLSNDHADNPGPSKATEASQQVERLMDAFLTSERTRENYRAFSVLALGRLKAKQAIPVLLAALEEDPDPLVRMESAHTLLPLAGPEAEEAFIAALKDQDSGVRLAAAVALKELRSPKAVTPLIAALNDPNRRVRFQAAETLGLLGHPTADAAIEPLKALVEKEQVLYVKQAAEAALGKLLPSAPGKSNGESK